MNIPLNQPPISLTNRQIEEILSAYPDKVSAALEKFKIAALDRQRLEAKTYLIFKARNAGQKVTEAYLDAMVRDDQQVYEANLAEIRAEATYLNLNETLMCAKKMSSLRTAF